MSADVFTQVSIEQVMGEEVSSGINTHYFEDKYSAKNWILSMDK